MWENAVKFVKQARTAREPQVVRWIYVSGATNLSYLVFFHLFCITSVYINLLFTYTHWPTVHTLVHLFLYVYIGYSMLCKKNMFFNMFFLVRCSIDDRSLSLRRFGLGLFILLVLSDRSSQPNFKLFREFLTSEKITSQRSYVAYVEAFYEDSTLHEYTLNHFSINYNHNCENVT